MFLSIIVFIDDFGIDVAVDLWFVDLAFVDISYADN
jgi:hypothetical protein